MQTTCSSCGARYNVSDEHQGKQTKCKKCGIVFTIEPFQAAYTVQASPVQVADAPWGMPQTPPPLPAGQIPPLPPSGPQYVNTAPVVKRTGLAYTILGLAMISCLLYIVITVQSHDLLQKLDRFKAMQASSYLGHVDVNQFEALRREILDSASNLKWYGSLVMVAGLARIVIWLVWVGLSYRNLYGLGAINMRFTPGGAVGWHFCPIANFWKVPMALNDMWIGSDPLRRNVSSWMIPLYMVLVVLGIPVRIADNTNPSQGLIIAELVIDLAIMILSTAIVLTITSFQGRKLEMMQPSSTANQQAMWGAPV